MNKTFTYFSWYWPSSEGDWLKHVKVSFILKIDALDGNCSLFLHYKV
jgi:hypothetical protein